MTSPATTSLAALSAVPSRRQAGLPEAVRSELTKIWSVRSTYWSLIVLLLASVGWSVAFCAGEAAHWAHQSAADRAGFDPAQSSVLGVCLLGQLVIVVLGALAITSEYATGMIRTSLTVLPRRGVLYAAKAGVFALVSLLFAVPASFASFFIGQRLLSGTGTAVTLSQPRVLPAVLMSAGYVVLCGLFAFGLGAVLRSTAGAITAAYGFLFLLPQLAKALPAAMYDDVVRWLPGGDVVAEITSTQNQLMSERLFSAAGEFGVFGAYTAVLLAAGIFVLRSRDA
jgi:ABC-2 type transport system permease protein